MQQLSGQQHLWGARARARPTVHAAASGGGEAFCRDVVGVRSAVKSEGKVRSAVSARKESEVCQRLHQRRQFSCCLL
jgi:hypothetical protein